MKQITIGTRASKLALMQTHWVIERLQLQWPHLEVHIEHIHTTGDRVTNLPLSRIGGDGVFVTEIERALHEHRIDLAVHSLKDLPTAQPADLRIVVPGPREDVRDVLVVNGALQLVNGQLRRAAPKEHAAPLRIGTCSLRRTAQLRALCPEAEILGLRGNVDTRLRKLAAGDYDGIILAAAGLHRLDADKRLADALLYFPPALMLPAPGQGALALEMRDEPEMLDLLAPLRALDVQAETAAERMFMRCLGAGCYLPVAAYAKIIDGRLTMHALVIRLDGEQRVAVEGSVPWSMASGIEYAEQLGVSLAEQALAQGADEIIRSIEAARAQEQEGQRV